MDFSHVSFSYTPEHTDPLLQIWQRAGKDAQSFLPESYWEENAAVIRQTLSESEVYVMEDEEGKEGGDSGVAGFIGLQDSCIAGFFVDRCFQSQGLGKRLLDYVKEKQSRLTLHVYRKNERAVRFYEREGFVVTARHTDPATGEEEFEMEWRR